jgi:hypothetical protein
MLYDATTDRLLQGFGLLENPVITTQDHPFSSMSYSTDQSFKDKASNLDINGSLNLSILSGLVQVQGSGKYLTEAKETSGKNVITLLFKGQTKVEKLVIPRSFEDQSHHFCKLRNHATHVVTSVTYGGNAICVFEEEASLSLDTSQVLGSFQAGFDEKVKKVTSNLVDVSVESKGDFKQVERQALAKVGFSCFGDFYSDKLVPSNLADALDFIKELPVLIKMTSVPIMATLCPLEVLLECKGTVRISTV